MYAVVQDTRMRKSHPNRLEKKLRKRPGLVWFSLMPFINGTVLHRWAVVKSHTYHPRGTP